jgi:hypothetical protein
MKKFFLILILLFLTVPCFAETGEFVYSLDASSSAPSSGDALIIDVVPHGTDSTKSIEFGTMMTNYPTRTNVTTSLDNQTHTGSTISGLGTADFTDDGVKQWDNDGVYVTSSGTVSQASSLTSDPSACAAGQFVKDVAANGTLTCDTPAGSGGAIGTINSGTIGQFPYYASTGTAIWGTSTLSIAGTMVTVVGTLAATTLTGSLDPDEIAGDTVDDNSVDGKIVSTVANAITAVTATGNAGTATALSANPTACEVGKYVNDMDANGTLTCGTPSTGGSISGVITAASPGYVAIYSQTDTIIFGTSTFQIAGSTITAGANITATGKLLTLGSVNASGTSTIPTLSGNVSATSSLLSLGSLNVSGTSTIPTLSGNVSNTAGLLTFGSANIAGTTTLGTLSATNINAYTLGGNIVGTGKLVTLGSVNISGTSTIAGYLTTALSSAKLLVGNSTNVAEARDISGDMTIGNDGVTVVANDSHDHTATTVSGLATADFTSANVGNWSNDVHYIKDVVASQGILRTGENLGLMVCTNGQILKNTSGTSWGCAADSTGGSPTFDSIATGSNSTATMTLAAGSTFQQTTGQLILGGNGTVEFTGGNVEYSGGRVYIGNGTGTISLTSFKRSATLFNPVSGDLIDFGKEPQALFVTNFYGTYLGGGATVTFLEADANSANATTIDAAIITGSTEATSPTTIYNSGITAGNHIEARIGTVNGATGTLTVTATGYIKP